MLAEYFSYSNDGFGLLSDIIRTQGGEDTYANYMKKHVLQPLGMSRSGCGFLPPSGDSNAAVLYEKRDGRPLITRDYHDNCLRHDGRRRHEIHHTGYGALSFAFPAPRRSFAFP